MNLENGKHIDGQQAGYYPFRSNTWSNAPGFNVHYIIIASYVMLRIRSNMMAKYRLPALHIWLEYEYDAITQTVKRTI